MKTVLVKVGGSLLTLPDLPNRLQAMIDCVTADRVMLLVGGGQAAGVVRSWDETHRLNTEASHWLAIDSMGLTARLLSKLLPDVELASDRASAHRSSVSTKAVVLDPRPVIEEASWEATRLLPTGWDCTSDSIAGWLACQWNVESLVLAKSIDMPMDDAPSTQRGSDVDSVFQSVISDSIPVYWCNVRTDPGGMALWKPASAGTSH